MNFVGSGIPDEKNLVKCTSGNPPVIGKNGDKCLADYDCQSWLVCWDEKQDHMWFDSSKGTGNRICKPAKSFLAACGTDADCPSDLKCFKEPQIKIDVERCVTQQIVAAYTPKPVTRTVPRATPKPTPQVITACSQVRMECIDSLSPSYGGSSSAYVLKNYSNAGVNVSVSWRSSNSSTTTKSIPLGPNGQETVGYVSFSSGGCSSNSFIIVGCN